MIADRHRVLLNADHVLRRAAISTRYGFLDADFSD
jgi:hypothetical protein